MTAQKKRKEKADFSKTPQLYIKLFLIPFTKLAKTQLLVFLY
jgi:hypothetical protein